MTYHLIVIIELMKGEILMFEAWQIILILLYVFIQPNETAGFKIGMDSPILAGWFTGLVLGNPAAGLYIGGTLQLMTLGVATYGGMSIPNTVIGAVIGTALSFSMDVQLALGIAIPVATFAIQLDVLRRYACVFLSNRADALIDKKEYDKAARMNLGGILVKGLAVTIPVLLVLVFGDAFAEGIMAAVPASFIAALKTSGGVMPVVGVVVLLRYLPLKSCWPYLVLGFLITAYLKVPMIALALFGIVIAFIDYNYNDKLESKATLLAEGGDIDE